MAKQKGIMKLEGTIGDITFYKTQDGYIAKENVTVSAARIASDPAFQRTRENMSEFGRAGKASKLIRNAFRTLLKDAKDSKVTGRLTGAMMKVIKADAVSARGLRNVMDGETELLTGFEFNNNAKLGTTLFAPFTGVINRVSGTLTINMPGFVPSDKIGAPAGSTHFKIVSMGAEIDFEQEVFVAAEQNSAILPIDTATTADLSLQNTVTANSIHPLFLLLGIQFFQFVNGVYYPLKDGGFNSLSLVNVSGV
jgi:hypothetical protein